MCISKLMRRSGTTHRPRPTRGLFWRLSLAASVSLLLGGCGGPSGPRTMRVWGDVTLDGKPIEAGSIVFSPFENTGGGSVGGVVTRGQYDLAAADGPVAGGKYRLEIS